MSFLPGKRRRYACLGVKRHKCYLWRMLHKDGMAPSTFGQISTKAWEYFTSMILLDKAFEFLLLCNNGEWKLREWLMRSYLSWHCNRFNEDADSPEKGKAHISHTVSYIV